LNELFLRVIPAKAGIHGPFGKFRGGPGTARRHERKGLSPRRRSVNHGRGMTAWRLPGPLPAAFNFVSKRAGI